MDPRRIRRRRTSLAPAGLAPFLSFAAAPPSKAPSGMRWIPPGEFTMGTDSGQSMANERPAHRVRLDGFWIDETPVTNAEFARALGRAMHRPALMPTPGFALKLLLGEMAGALLLSGQNALPAKATREGFAFRYARVDDALGAIFARA